MQDKNNISSILTWIFAALLVFTPIAAHADNTTEEYRINLLTYGGAPNVTAANLEVKILINSAYAVGYSEELKNPLWVIYRLGNMKDNGAITKWERPNGFLVDTRTSAKVTHEDYTSTGYDRGHMAPNAAMLAQYGQLAQLETYLMSNITPQTPKLNRRIWAELEKKVREEISQDDTKNKEVHDIYVITGPIFDTEEPETLDSGVAIPTSFYKILAYKRGWGGTIKAVALVFPQNPKSKNFLDYITTVDDVESLTGIDFFSELSIRKQRNLENKRRDLDLNEITD